MLTHEELLDYVKGDGWKSGKASNDIVVLVSVTSAWQRISIPTFAASHQEKGVYLRWFPCAAGRYDFSRNTSCYGGCTTDDHIHLEIKKRTNAGGLLSGPALTVPTDISIVQNARGAPFTRKVITKSNLPEPYTFVSEKITNDPVSRRRHSYSRISAIRHCTLVGVVGISDKAKIVADAAAIPGADVWFHFECTSYSSATFDIITNGETFYPINRQSHKISMNLKPKPSVDLTQLSCYDQELLIHAIVEYSKL